MCTKLRSDLYPALGLTYGLRCKGRRAVVGNTLSLRRTGTPWSEIEGLHGVEHDTWEEPMSCTKARAPVALSLILASSLAVLSTDSRAQDYPSRTIHIISQTPAGGTADVITRLFADHLSTAFKQT